MPKPAWCSQAARQTKQHRLQRPKSGPELLCLPRNSDGKADTVYGGDLLATLEVDLSAARRRAGTRRSALCRVHRYRALGNPQPIRRSRNRHRLGRGCDVIRYRPLFRRWRQQSGRKPADTERVWRARPVHRRPRRYPHQSRPTVDHRPEQPDLAQRRRRGVASDHGQRRPVRQQEWLLHGPRRRRRRRTSGEGRDFIRTPRIQNGIVFFTTFEPVGDGCTPGGQNWIYGMAIINGGAALQNVQIDSSGTPACSGSCGGLAIAQGAPVTKTSVFIPRPPEIPGLTCDPADPRAYRRRIRCSSAPWDPCGRLAPLSLPRPCGAT